MHSIPRTAFATLLLAGMLTLLTACGGDEDPAPGDGLSGTLSIEGSSTVAPYTRLAIDAFEERNAGATVTTGEVGSGGGITALIGGHVPLAASSRPITEDERAQAAAEVFETRIFNDALAIVVHPSNAVRALTLEEVAKIFAGDIRNWSEVGGHDESITLYTRNEESGSFAYIEDEVIRAVLGDSAEYDPDINKQASSPAGLTAVAGDPDGIFYAGLGNLADIPPGKVRVVPVAAEPGTEPVLPSEESVMSGAYPIARGLYYYSNGDPLQSPDPLVRAFVEFVLSPEGQEIGRELGFVPVRTTSVIPRPTLPRRAA
jgi:phosphate transport system substrate-binding protein